MTEEKHDDWVKADETFHVKLVPCPRAFGHRRDSWACPVDEDGHHHLSFMCDDGVGDVFPPIDSRPFLEVVTGLVLPGSMTEELKAAILSHGNVERLAGAVTERERRILDDPAELKRLLRFHWISN